MFSELVPSLVLVDELVRRSENWGFNTIWRRWLFVMCENYFPFVFLSWWRPKRLVVLKFERCEHGDDTPIVDADQEGVKC